MLLPFFNNSCGIDVRVLEAARPKRAEREVQHLHLKRGVARCGLTRRDRNGECRFSTAEAAALGWRGDVLSRSSSSSESIMMCGRSRRRTAVDCLWLRKRQQHGGQQLYSTTMQSPYFRSHVHACQECTFIGPRSASRCAHGEAAQISGVIERW